ncbi:MAG: hypothetical protein IJT95_05385 [Abditibacteriota bacterium]|nr:hypothetical protein [Abditibacteriota bacterium]
MKQLYDLSQYTWRLSGWTPELWRMRKTAETGAAAGAEIPPMECRIPCSVQKVLRDHGRISDWNIGRNYRDIEWVEHRHWIFETRLPGSMFEKGKRYYFVSEGLDYKGEVYFNGSLIGSFENSFLPVSFPIREPRQGDNLLSIVFLEAPSWLGQFGKTSRITEPKVRFYYGWDWTCRFVQTGIWDKTCIKAVSGNTVKSLRVEADADPETKTGLLRVKAAFEKPCNGNVCIRLKDGEDTVFTSLCRVSGSEMNVTLEGLPVELWDVNLQGSQPLYLAEIEFEDLNETEVRRIGFRHIEWKRTEGAAPQRGPWLCVINGRETFLQGFNWVPPYVNFADCRPEDYAALIKIYRDLGVNVLRINGVGVLGSE